MTTTTSNPPREVVRRVSDERVAIQCNFIVTEGRPDDRRLVDDVWLDLRDSRAREADLTRERDEARRALYDYRPLLMAQSELAFAKERIADLTRRLAEVERERDGLSDEVHDLRQAPWPEWAERCLKIVRECNGAVDDEVDLPEELEELLSEWDDFESKWKAEKARADAAERDNEALRQRADAAKRALASDARVETILSAILTARDDPEDGTRDHLPRSLRDYLSAECGASFKTGWDDGYAEGYAKALPAAAAKDEVRHE